LQFLCNGVCGRLDITARKLLIYSCMEYLAPVVPGYNLKLTTFVLFTFEAQWSDTCKGCAIF
jgi:hypothetical protein